MEAEGADRRGGARRAVGLDVVTVSAFVSVRFACVVSSGKWVQSAKSRDITIGDATPDTAAHGAVEQPVYGGLWLYGGLWHGALQHRVLARACACARALRLHSEAVVKAAGVGKACRGLGCRDGVCCLRVGAVCLRRVERQVGAVSRIARYHNRRRHARHGCTRCRGTPCV